MAMTASSPKKIAAQPAATICAMSASRLRSLPASAPRESAAGRRATAIALAHPANALAIAIAARTLGSLQGVPVIMIW